MTRTFRKIKDKIFLICPIPYPRARRAGLVPRVARGGGGVTGHTEPCIMRHIYISPPQLRFDIFSQNCEKCPNQFCHQKHKFNLKPALTQNFLTGACVDVFFFLVCLLFSTDRSLLHLIPLNCFSFGT